MTILGPCPMTAGRLPGTSSSNSHSCGAAACRLPFVKSCCAAFVPAQAVTACVHINALQTDPSHATRLMRKLGGHVLLTDLTYSRTQSCQVCITFVHAVRGGAVEFQLCFHSLVFREHLLRQQLSSNILHCTTANIKGPPVNNTQLQSLA